MASPHQEGAKDIGDAVILASTHLPFQPSLPTPAVCHSMCEIILAGIYYSFGVNPQTLWTYFGLCLRQPRRQQVGRATRLLLSCRAFVTHAHEADSRIRPLLVAGAMLHAPAKDAYRFILKTNFYPAMVSVCPSLDTTACDACADTTTTTTVPLGYSLHSTKQSYRSAAGLLRESPTLDAHDTCSVFAFIWSGCYSRIPLWYTTQAKPAFETCRLCTTYKQSDRFTTAELRAAVELLPLHNRSSMRQLNSLSSPSSS